MSTEQEQDQPTPRPAEIASPVDRREWLKGAAAMVGGAAAVVGGAPASLGPSPAARVPDDPGPQRVATPEKAIVETTAGKVRGFTRNGIYVYRGIPYGDTTAGANRFLPPKKPQPWAGVRASTSWGPVSPHGPRAGWVNDEEQFLYQWDDGFPGEDMLRVNVWTAAVNDGRKRPVLVWIHGGGFSSGSSQELRAYDGENLARKHGVVLVSMNHRLNVFGFLDLSSFGGEPYASSANAGMLDLVLALEWVRDNIASFGGDPGNVTIFGQSGGGSKVATLMAMPAATGLFHKAVVMSGSALRQGTPDASARVAAAVLDELGIGRTQLDRLREVPTSELLRAGITGPRKLTQQAAAGGTAPTVPGAIPATTPPPTPGAPGPRIGWGPVVDGRVLPQHPFDPAAPSITASVPMMIGTTFHEFNGGIDKPAAHRMTLDELRQELAPRFGTKAGDVIAAYQQLLPNAKPFELRAVILTSRTNAVTQGERKAALGAAPAYMYWFGWKTPVLDGRPLAFHCADLAFWFDNIDRCAQATGGTTAARALADRMSKALVSFARTGNPSHAGIPKWPAFTEAARATMILDDRVEVKGDPDRDARRQAALAASQSAQR